MLAAGGIENARLLLASRGQLPRGVGNDTDLVGRGYMSHLAGTFGYICLNQRSKPPFYRWHRDAQGAYCRRRFQLSEAAQLELEVMGVAGFPFRPEYDDAGHGDAVLSFNHLCAAAARGWKNSDGTRRQLGRHLRNFLIAHPAAWAIGAARQAIPASAASPVAVRSAVRFSCTRRAVLPERARTEFGESVRVDR